MQGGIGGINFDEWVKVLYGLVLSLALGFFTGWIICRILSVVCAAMDKRRTDGFFKGAQIFGAAFMSFMHGAQDGQKFIGVLFLGIAFCNGQSSVNGMSIPVWLMLPLQCGYGRGNKCRRRKDYQICRHGYGEAGKVSGIFSGSGRRVLSAAFQHIWHSGIHYAYKDKRDHGRGSGEAAFGN